MPLRRLPRTTGNAQDVPTTGKQTNQPKTTRADPEFSNYDFTS